MAEARTQDHKLSVPARVVVTGDTHLGARRDWLPEQLVAELFDADTVIHTGDFGSPQALELFQQFAPVLAISGNNDVGEPFDDLPHRLRIAAGGVDIIVTHGHRERGRSARDAVQRAYAGTWDLVIYGHSHQVHWEEVNGTWFLNPGSPTMKRWEPRFSFAILEIDDSGHFDARTEYFDRQIRPAEQPRRDSKQKRGLHDESE